MDSLDLLAREDEFKKLNKQLEKKTESLMKEIEHVMQKQDFFSDFSHSLSITPHSTPKRHICAPPPQVTTPTKPTFKRKTLKSPKHVSVESVEGSKTVETSLNVEVKEQSIGVCEKRVVCDCCDHTKGRKTDDEQFLQAFVAVGVQERVFPQSFLKDNISVENICKFLSSKVKLMQEQIDKLQTNLDRKAIQCKSHLTQQAELEGERLTLLNKNNNLRAAAADAKAKCMALENRLAEKDRLYKEQRSECDKLTCEVKRLRSDLIGTSSRHAALQETVSSLTQQLKATKAEYAEFRESTRQLAISHQQAIATLEARAAALAVTTDKQTALIDNLRKQSTVLSMERAVAATDRDYWDYLNKEK